MRWRAYLAGLAAAMLAALTPTGASAPLAANEPSVPVVVAAFDNYDTSGEAAEATAAHEARVAGFDGLLREALAEGGGFEVLDLPCAAPPCSAGAMAPEALLAAARAAGARLLVYGGVHKMSTLVQWGKLGVVDLEGDRLLLDNSFTFRGDSDEAFRRAAEFVTRYVRKVTQRE